MAFYEIARFLDLNEAQVAAAALRASGITVFVQNEAWGQAMWHYQYAMGGFRLWVPEADAADARAFIRARRSEPSRLRPTPLPEGVARSALALLILLFGICAPVLPRDRLADEQAD